MNVQPTNSYGFNASFNLRRTKRSSEDKKTSPRYEEVYLIKWPVQHINKIIRKNSNILFLNR